MHQPKRSLSAAAADKKRTLKASPTNESLASPSQSPPSNERPPPVAAGPWGRTRRLSPGLPEATPTDGNTERKSTSPRPNPLLQGPSTPRRPNPLLTSPSSVASPHLSPSPSVPGSSPDTRAHGLQRSPTKEAKKRGSSEAKRATFKSAHNTSDAASSQESSLASPESSLRSHTEKAKKKKSIKSIAESPTSPSTGASRRSAAPSPSTTKSSPDKDRKQWNLQEENSSSSFGFIELSPNPSEFFQSLIGTPSQDPSTPSPNRRATSRQSRHALKSTTTEASNAPNNRPGSPNRRKTVPKKDQEQTSSQLSSSTSATTLGSSSAATTASSSPSTAPSGRGERARTTQGARRLTSLAEAGPGQASHGKKPLPQVVGNATPVVAPWDTPDYTKADYASTQPLIQNTSSTEGMSPTSRTQHKNRWSPRTTSPSTASPPQSPANSPIRGAVEEEGLANFGASTVVKERKRLVSKDTNDRGFDYPSGRAHLAVDDRVVDTEDCSQGFNLTFGRGGLESQAPEEPAGKIIDHKKSAKKGVFEVEQCSSAFTTVVKPKKNKGLADGNFPEPIIPTADKNLVSKPAPASQAKRQEAIVRLPRVQDWSNKSPNPFGGKRTTDWGPAARVYQQQHVLGSAGLEAGKRALARWYLPYLVVALLGAGVSGLVFGRTHFLLCQLPVLALLSALHIYRISRWEHALHVSIDLCARAEVRNQLNAPMGWGEGAQIFSAQLPIMLQTVLDSRGPLLRSGLAATSLSSQTPGATMTTTTVTTTTAATTTAAATTAAATAAAARAGPNFKKAANSSKKPSSSRRLGDSAAKLVGNFPAVSDFVLLSPPIWLQLRWLMALVGTLSLIRLIRLLAEPDGIWASVWESLEVISALGALLALTFVACSHTQSGRARRSEANKRIDALEAAFNTMLDVLRPLLGPSAGPADYGSSSGVHDLGWSANSHRLTSTHFSVRLLTSEGQTLRAVLKLDYGQVKTITATCPLANFSVSYSSIDSAMPTYLGPIESCASEVLRTGNLPPGANVGSSWSSQLLSRFRASPNRSQDDANSISMSSHSTAATLTSKKSGQVDEFSLHMAANLLATLSSRRKYPLETFASPSRGGCGVMPPKATVDEACLVLALESSKLQISPGVVRSLLLLSRRRLQGQNPLPAAVATATAASRATIGGSGKTTTPRGTNGGGRGYSYELSLLEPKDDLGVLRDGRELERLLHPDLNRQGSPDSPRSDGGASCGSWSDLEQESGSPSFGPPRVATPRGEENTATPKTPPKHLAMLFDTVAERDCCLSVLRSVGLLPKTFQFGEP